MIKVQIPLKNKKFSTENVWIKKLSYNLGKIKNIPYFASGYKYDDVVEFDPKSRIVRELVADGGYTRSRFYKFTCDPQLARYHWFDKGYIVEFFSSNLLVACRPRDKKEWIKRKKINWRTHLSD